MSDRVTEVGVVDGGRKSITIKRNREKNSSRAIIDNLIASIQKVCVCFNFFIDKVRKDDFMASG